MRRKIEARDVTEPRPDGASPTNGTRAASDLLATSAAGATHHLAGAKRYQVLAAVLTVMFFSSMASTVVSTALPTIATDLHGLSLYAWVFTAFMLASAVSIPVYGKMSDVLGRKPLYVVAIGLYVVGNTIAGFSQSMEVLIVARAVSGLGGGGMMALSQITIGDVFTPQERGRWMGVMMSAFGLASIVGPVMGGALTESVGWRWIFWINVPVALVPLAALLYTLPTVRNPRKVSIDYLGMAALVLGLVPLLLAITWVGDGYTWSSSRVALAGIFGIAVLVLFVLQEVRAEEPLVSPGFFRNGIFVACMLASFFVALAMYGSILYIPLFVQGVVGAGAKDSGLILAPMMVGFVAGSFVSGQAVSRWGRYRIQALIGLALAIAGSFLLAMMDVHTSNSTVIRNMVILGIGIGTTMPLFSIAVQNAFPYSVLGAVTGSRQFFTSLGGTIGVPIMGALLNAGFGTEFSQHLSPRLKSVLDSHRGISLDPNSLLSSQSQVAVQSEFLRLGTSGTAMYHQFIFAVRDGLALSMRPLFFVAMGFMIAGFVVSMFLKEIPLRRSNLEPRDLATEEAVTTVNTPEPVLAGQTARSLLD